MPITGQLPPSLPRHLSSALALALLQSCTSFPQFHQLHAHLICRGEAANPFVATRLLEFCAVSGNSATAAAIFNSHDRPNVYVWTAMIRCCVAAKRPYHAIGYYDSMRSFGVDPYKFSFVFVLKACSLVGDVRKGREVHGSVLKVGLQMDSYLRSALVTLYSSCGEVGAAYGMFREVQVEENLVIWNSMIVGCFLNGEMERAKGLFDEMRVKDVTTWNVVINGYSKLGHVDIARRLFDEMPERDLLSWSSMVAGYVQSGKAVEALLLFQEMVRAGIRPDGVTMATSLSACSQVGALDMGKWIHSYVNKNRIRHDVVLGSSLVDMYAKCGCIELALQVFHGMTLKNVCTWNAMICGLAIHGHGSLALSLFKEMELAHVLPTDITFVGVLSACSHVGAVDEGRKQFDRMCHEFRIIPKVEHYGCLVDLLGRSGLMDESRDIILSMPVEPNLVVLGAYLSACRMHGNLNPGEWFMRLISKLDPGDGWCHVLLSNIFASRNQWEEVARVRKLMKGDGVQKVPGCSSIEVNSVVHEFLMGDKSHHNWREVFDTIDKLSSHLKVSNSFASIAICR